MGKLALLLVASAILGGVAVSFSTRATAGATSRVQSEAQADQLAREIAETGRSLVLTRMLGADGFVNPGVGTVDYDGGRYSVTVEPSADGQTAVVTSRGQYGGAVHTLRGTYRFVPMLYPGPIWLDVPYATSRITSGTPTVRGGPQNLPVRFDPRRHALLGLATPLPLSGITSDFHTDMRAAGSSFPAPNAGLWPGLLAGLNVNDAEDLYQVALGAMTAADRTLAGPLTLSSPLSAPGPTAITRVTGPLTIATGGYLSGQGLLIVEGDLVVQPGGRLDWTGLVLVRSLSESLPVHLNGVVTVTGGLAVTQEAFPPGGHIDATVWRSVTSAAPAGDTNGPWAAPGQGPFPWYNHTHRWESEVPEGRTLYFAEASRDRHEAHLNFRAALAAAGSANVYLEFRNPTTHGHSFYRLAIDGRSEPIAGTVRNGFPSGFRTAGSAHRSVAFPANRLRDFVVDVRSLRALRQRFDGPACTSWPYCLGQDGSRGGALTVRLVRASGGAVLYEAALYWHMRADEAAAYVAAETAWRTSVTSGTGFGTHLQMGDDATVAFALAPLRALGDRLGFDDNTLEVVNTTSSHQTTRDTRVAAR